MLICQIALTNLFVSEEFKHCPEDNCFLLDGSKDENADYKFKCPQCGKYTCEHCGEVHENEMVSCMAKCGLRRCKRCHVYYSKSSGCNRIPCPCGAHNCYLC